MEVKGFSFAKNRVIAEDYSKVSKISDLCLIQNNIIYSPLTRDIFIADEKEFEKMKNMEKSKEHFPKLGTEKTLNIFLTTACNLRCIYCYARGGEEPLVINPNFVKRAIDEFAKNKNELNLFFHGGGEVTQKIEEVKEILDYTKTKVKNVSVSLGTNGVFSKEILEWLVKNKFHFTVSIDGPPEIQDKQRPSPFNRASNSAVERTIKKLVELKYEFNTRTTISAFSVKKMLENVEYFHNLRIKNIHLEPLYESGRSLKATSIYARAPDLKEYEKNLLKAAELAEEYGMHMYSTFISTLNVPRNAFCGAAGTNFSLTTDGYITACHEAALEKHGPKEFIYGKYNKEKDEIEIFEDRFEHLKNRTVRNMPYCQDCYIKWNCAGDCLIKVFNKTGDMYKPDKERCGVKKELTKQYLIYKAKKELLGWKPTITKNKVLKMFFNEVPLKAVKNNGKFSSNAYIEIDLSRTDLNKLAEQMKDVKKKNEWKPMLFVLNFNLKEDELTATNGKKITDFLETLQKNKIRYKIVTPLGYCMLGPDYEKINEKLKIPAKKGEFVIDANLRANAIKKCSSCIYRIRKKCMI